VFGCDNSITADLHDMSHSGAINEVSIEGTLHREPEFTNQNFNAALFWRIKRSHARSTVSVLSSDRTTSIPLLYNYQDNEQHIFLH
jgi:hypothetical protein